MKNFYVLLGAIAVVGAVMLFMASGGSTLPVTPIPEDAILAGADFPGYVLGSADAPVEVVEYADFECAACQYWWLLTVRDVKERLVKTGQVRYVFRDFPLEMHPKARFAHHAAACAADQGLFEPVHDLLFQNQKRWAAESGTGESTFREYVETAGADMGDYDVCMTEGRHRGRIEASVQAGTAMGVSSTPTFQIGRTLYTGLTYDQVKAIVDSLTAAGGQ